MNMFSGIKNNKSQWKTEKNRILSLPIEEKRMLYKFQDYVPENRIVTWSLYSQRNDLSDRTPTLDDLAEYKKNKFNPELDQLLRERVAIYQGDITKLEVDAVVNAANSALRAGGGVDGAIHRAAGRLLQEECNTLKGCQTGDAKITSGYNLPAKYVIHAVGPRDGSAKALQSCYEKSLSYHKEYKLKSIAFPCISTGVYHFPNRQAAHIALSTARNFLEKNKDVEKFVFCTFLPIDIEIYETLMQLYFPLDACKSNPEQNATTT